MRSVRIVIIYVIYNVAQYISYGMGDGAIKVLKTENGEILLTVSDHLAE